MHGVRFGSHKEQAYIVDGTESSYDALTFNANLVAWSATGIAAFVCSSYKLAGKKEFFIDPLTHSFQHEPSVLENDEGEVKPSVKKLVNHYGPPVEDRVGHSAVLPGDFEGEELRKAFVQRVIEFQQDRLDDEARETDAWEMLEFKYKQEEGGQLDLTPSFVVAPYFFMRKSTVDKWLSYNTAMIEEALSEFDGDVAAEIVMSPDIIGHEETREKVAKAYSELEVSKILIWLDGFSEHDVSQEELKELHEFVVEVGRGGKEVVNLYGGYFSMLMAGSGESLSGVCHGPGYGEDREVTPVGGGLPRARFYFFDLHKRLRFAEALRLFEKNDWLTSKQTFFENICSCPECERLLGKYGVEEGFKKYGETKPVTFTRAGSTVSMDFPVAEAQRAAARHYLHNKHREWKSVKKWDKQELANQLSESRKRAARVLGLDSVAYLENWENALFGD